jgi:hypothetical protein
MPPPTKKVSRGSRIRSAKTLQQRDGCVRLRNDVTLMDGHVQQVQGYGERHIDSACNDEKSSGGRACSNANQRSDGPAGIRSSVAP